MMIISLALLLPTLGACSLGGTWRPNHWIADFDVAEREVVASQRSMVIRYIDNRPGRKDALESVVADRRVRSVLKNYVCCSLVRSYEPDRRYVAQFGVERAPALIVVHPDGTAHAQTGLRTVEDVVGFLDNTTSPGKPVAADPWIPRNAYYAWHGNLAKAQEAANEQQVPLLIVYYRRMTGDWNALEDMLMRPEVFRRLSGMVYCRRGGWNPMADTTQTPFADMNLPALVIVKTDGTHSILEMPISSDAVVRFAARVLAAETDEHSASAGQTEQR